MVVATVLFVNVLVRRHAIKGSISLEINEISDSVKPQLSGYISPVQHFL